MNYFDGVFWNGSNIDEVKELFPNAYIIDEHLIIDYCFHPICMRTWIFKGYYHIFWITDSKLDHYYDSLP